MYYNYTCLYLLYALYFHLITCACISMLHYIAFSAVCITTENIEQAIERAGTKAGNKGYDCAMGALEMIDLMKQL